MSQAKEDHPCGIETCLHGLFGIALRLDEEVEKDVPEEYKNFDDDDEEKEEVKKETKNANWIRLESKAAQEVQ